MACKYLREVCMRQFNRFWAKHVPGLKPTAGYPTDAKRFYDAIRPAMARLGMSRGRGVAVAVSLRRSRWKTHRTNRLTFVAPSCKLEAVAVGEGVGELLLVAHQQDAVQVPAEVLQLLDHHLPAGAVEAAEALVDDDALDRPVLPARVLADAQRQATATRNRWLPLRNATLIGAPPVTRLAHSRSSALSAPAPSSVPTSRQWEVCGKRRGRPPH